MKARDPRPIWDAVSYGQLIGGVILFAGMLMFFAGMDDANVLKMLAGGFLFWFGLGR